MVSNNKVKQVLIIVLTSSHICYLHRAVKSVAEQINIKNWKCKLLINVNTLSDSYYNEVLDFYSWLHNNRTEGCTTYAMNLAAENGHLEIVKWLHNNRTEGCTTYAMNHAAENDHLEIVKWLYNNRTEGSTTYAMNPDW